MRPSDALMPVLHASVTANALQARLGLLQEFVVALGAQIVPKRPVYAIFDVVSVLRAQ